MAPEVPHALADTRRRNLARLLARERAKHTLAEWMNTSTQYVLSLARGASVFYDIRARAIEQHLGVASGWMDVDQLDSSTDVDAVFRNRLNELKEKERRALAVAGQRVARMQRVSRMRADMDRAKKAQASLFQAG